MFNDATETAEVDPEWTSDNKDTESPMGKSATTYAMYWWYFAEIIVWRPERCLIPSRARKDFRPSTKGAFSSLAISYYLPCFPWVKFNGPNWIIHERISWEGRVVRLPHQGVQPPTFFLSHFWQKGTHLLYHLLKNVTSWSHTSLTQGMK